jgi:2-hydroxycyclohexanecarboxyl-CoA dehydrogenase
MDGHMKPPNDMHGRVVLITGGSAGIGFKIAGTLLAAGATVIINGRDTTRGARALESLASDRAFFEAGDCSDAEGAREVVANVTGRHGGISSLVASGGAAHRTPHLFQDVTDDDFGEIYRAQFLNRVFPIRAALPHMRESGGSIVILSTDAGRHSTVGESIHGAMGAAKIMLTKTLAREFGRWHIRVNCLALTITSGTESFEAVINGDGWARGIFEKAVRRFPFGRPPDADEVARVALFLASDQSAQVTGQTISVNGGLSFGGW